MSDTNRTEIGITEESQFGVIPSNPVFETLRVTSSSLAYNPNTVVSDEIRSDRQVTDNILVGAEAGGEVGVEISYAAQDTLLQGLMFSTWVTKPTDINTAADTPISVDDVGDSYDIAGGTNSYVAGHLVRATGFTESANNSLFVAESGTSSTAIECPNDLVAETAPSGARVRVVGFAGASGDLEIDASGDLISTTLDFTTLGLVAGEWIKIGGFDSANQFANAVNNDWVKIGSIAANKITFSEGNDNFTTDDGTGKVIYIWSGDYIRNGTTERSYTIERQYTDHTPVTYEYFRGHEVGEFTLTLDAQAVATASFTFSGRDALAVETREAGATDQAAPTNPVMNTSSNVGYIKEGGATLSGVNLVLSATVSVNNNLRFQNAVGELGAVGIGVGEFGVSGNLNTYFDNKDLYDKLLANSESSFSTQLSDINGKTLVYDIPRIKFSAGAPSVSGKNADVELPLEYVGLRDATLGYTLQIQRFHETGETA